MPASAASPPAEFIYDSAVPIGPQVARVLASNPSPMTGRGTNTYLLGGNDLIVIDPGPSEDSHLEALVRICADRLRYILVTHHHRDHAPLAASLGEATGAVVLAHGLGEFVPDGTLADGDVVKVPGVSLRVLHTPGHASDHLCYLIDGEDDTPHLLFSGDHVLGGTTTVIPPPDGDMGAYLSSLERLLGLSSEIEAIAPGHGALIDDPRAVLTGYLDHRRERQREVVDTLAALGRADTTAIIDAVYVGLAEPLRRLARSMTWAYLRMLAPQGIVHSDDPDDPDAQWSYVGEGVTAD